MNVVLEYRPTTITGFMQVMLLSESIAANLTAMSHCMNWVAPSPAEETSFNNRGRRNTSVIWIAAAYRGAKTDGNRAEPDENEMIAMYEAKQNIIVRPYVKRTAFSDADLEKRLPGATSERCYRAKSTLSNGD
ncbi:MAG: hypothetical protein MMC33_002385 [Icmadophila ericetorum]|nr:hypothetical protein [Icmadophila ericetorum]